MNYIGIKVHSRVERPAPVYSHYHYHDFADRVAPGGRFFRSVGEETTLRVLVPVGRLGFFVEGGFRICFIP